MNKCGRFVNYLSVTSLASKSVADGAVDIVPFVLVVLKEPKSVSTVFIVKDVWRVFRPIMKVKRCSVAPHKCTPFTVDIRQAQPRVFSTV